MESRSRTIVKTVLWTLLGFLVMTGVGILLTGSVTLGGTMAVINSLLGFLTYFLYERVWARIRWGRL
ncbi:MAG: DUF2061 domain-containing protein [Pseudomonadota bacterium]